MRRHAFPLPQTKVKVRGTSEWNTYLPASSSGILEIEGWGGDAV